MTILRIASAAGILPISCVFDSGDGGRLGSDRSNEFGCPVVGGSSTPATSTLLSPADAFRKGGVSRGVAHQGSHRWLNRGLVCLFRTIARTRHVDSIIASCSRAVRSIGRVGYASSAGRTRSSSRCRIRSFCYNIRFPHRAEVIHPQIECSILTRGTKWIEMVPLSFYFGSSSCILPEATRARSRRG